MKFPWSSQTGSFHPIEFCDYKFYNEDKYELLFQLFIYYRKPFTK